MDVCADARMACGCPVPLLADGIRRRKDAVVDRSRFSNKASSLKIQHFVGTLGQDQRSRIGKPRPRGNGPRFGPQSDDFPPRSAIAQNGPIG